jgi:hypothetical protein
VSAAIRAATLLAALPEGAFTGTANHRRYRATRTTFADTRALKFEAWDLAGAEHISMNLYLLASGPTFRPCETTAEHALSFLETFAPDPA